MLFAASLLLLVVLSPTFIDEVANKICENENFERASLSVQRVPKTARKAQFRNDRPASQIFWLRSSLSNLSEELKMADRTSLFALHSLTETMFCSSKSECNEEA